jgi:hypothetical protein
MSWIGALVWRRMALPLGNQSTGRQLAVRRLAFGRATREHPSGPRQVLDPILLCGAFLWITAGERATPA